MTKKPYYKLMIGKKPHTSADLRFPAGRVRVEVSDSLRDTIKIADIIQVRWLDMLRSIRQAFEATPAGVPSVLTEPKDRPLVREIADIEARVAARAAREPK